MEEEEEEEEEGMLFRNVHARGAIPSEEEEEEEENEGGVRTTTGACLHRYRPYVLAKGGWNLLPIPIDQDFLPSPASFLLYKSCALRTPRATMARNTSGVC